MECKKESNKANCTCTYNCSKKGMCCECVKAHREAGEIPGCFFSKEGERTYDRSIQNFIKSTTVVD
jgi:hypothetical protein